MTSEANTTRPMHKTHELKAFLMHKQNCIYLYIYTIDYRHIEYRIQFLSQTPISDCRLHLCLSYNRLHGRLKLIKVVGGMTDHVGSNLPGGNRGIFFLSFRLDGSGQITVIPAELRGFWEMDGLDLDWMDVILLKQAAKALKIRWAPKGNNRIPTIHVQVRAVSFTEGIFHILVRFLTGWGMCLYTSCSW